MKKLLFSVWIALLALGCNEQVRTAPEFDFQRVAGGNMSSADLKGKVVVLDFWATWCDPCIEEVPAYNKLADSMPAGATLVSIVMDSGSFEDVKEEVGKLGIQYPVLMGKDGIEEKFVLRGYPTTFLLDKDWKIYKKYEGNPPKKQEQLRQDIALLLGE